MTSAHRADFIPPKVVADDLDARLKADRAFYVQQDVELAAIEDGTAKVVLGHWTCTWCGNESESPIFCDRCGDVVAKHDFMVTGWVRDNWNGNGCRVGSLQPEDVMR